MISVLCLRIGNIYGIEYVEKLRNMVSRHLTIPYEFVCITDQDIKLPGVRNILVKGDEYNKAWWYKVHMFDPTLDLLDYILYFDLDVVIHDNIDKLVIKSDTLYGIQDFNRKFHENWYKLNSSVLFWKKGNHSDIWYKFKTIDYKSFYGDQDWIWFIERHNMTFWPKEWLLSYKWEVRNKEELSRYDGRLYFMHKSSIVPEKDCSVTIFHGTPKPNEVYDQYVIDNWI